MAFVGDVLGEVVSGVGAERVRESAKAMSFAIEALRMLCLTKSGESGKDCKGVVRSSER